MITKEYGTIQIRNWEELSIAGTVDPGGSFLNIAIKGCGSLRWRIYLSHEQAGDLLAILDEFTSDHECAVLAAVGLAETEKTAEEVWQGAIAGNLDDIESLGEVVTRAMDGDQGCLDKMRMCFDLPARLDPGLCTPEETVRECPKAEEQLAAVRTMQGAIDGCPACAIKLVKGIVLTSLEHGEACRNAMLDSARDGAVGRYEPSAEEECDPDAGKCPQVVVLDNGYTLIIDNEGGVTLLDKNNEWVAAYFTENVSTNVMLATIKVYRNS